MSKWILAALVAVLTYSLTGCGQMVPSAGMTASDTLSARNAARAGGAQATQELLVKFKSQINPSSIQTFHAQFGLRTLRVIPGLNVHVMTVTGSRSMAQVLAQVSQHPMVEYAEPNQGIRLNDGQLRF